MHGESECVQLCSDISLGALLFGHLVGVMLQIFRNV